MCEGSYIERIVEVGVMMALLHYFQVTPHRGLSGDLSNPARPLSLLQPSSAIEESNVAVASIQQQWWLPKSPCILGSQCDEFFLKSKFSMTTFSLSYLYSTTHLTLHADYADFNGLNPNYSEI